MAGEVDVQPAGAGRCPLEDAVKRRIDLVKDRVLGGRLLAHHQLEVGGLRHAGRADEPLTDPLGIQNRTLQGPQIRVVGNPDDDREVLGIHHAPAATSLSYTSGRFQYSLCEVGNGARVSTSMSLTSVKIGAARKLSASSGSQRLRQAPRDSGGADR